MDFSRVAEIVVRNLNAEQAACRKSLQAAGLLDERNRDLANFLQSKEHSGDHNSLPKVVLSPGHHGAENEQNKPQRPQDGPTTVPPKSGGQPKFAPLPSVAEGADKIQKTPDAKIDKPHSSTKDLHFNHARRPIQA